MVLPLVVHNNNNIKTALSRTIWHGLNSSQTNIFYLQSRFTTTPLYLDHPDMTYSPLLVPVSLLFPICLCIFVAVGALESPSVRAFPYVVFMTIVLMQFRLIAYYFYVTKNPGLQLLKI